ncbi:hypothetical protein [Williamsia soli]|uniref:hypothetical protein n=1 Tax=Williamsia soli TaxID=364929 RepID=UPI001A9D0B1C|nr:hypothetical protein [Williamsia soli]
MAVRQHQGKSLEHETESGATQLAVSSGRATFGGLAFSLLAVPAIFDLPLAGLAVLCPLVFAITFKRLRPLYLAIFVGCSLTWLGTAGQLSYLGVSSISSESFRFALLFGIVLAAIIAILGSLRSGSRSKAYGIEVSTRSHVFLLMLALLLLANRLSSGIPLLQGNEARLQSVASESPIMGIALGSAVISAAFLRSSPRASIGALQILLVIMTLGTASRLLIVAVLLGVATGYLGHLNRFSGIARSLVAASAGFVVLGAALLTYGARTEGRLEAIQSERANAIGGFAGFFNETLGPSLYLSARNGLSVNELIQSGGLQPPGGFIIGGATKSLGLSGGFADPERWLTTALGFSVDSTGAIATPIWSGALSDYGFLGGLLLAAVVGALCVLYVDFVPGSVVWLSVGIVFSFYGSYLVSAQFIGASLLLAMISIGTRYLRAGEVPKSEPRSASVAPDCSTNKGM